MTWCSLGDMFAQNVGTVIRELKMHIPHKFLQKKILILTVQQIYRSVRSPLSNKVAYEAVWCVQAVWLYGTDQDSHPQ